jgi:hypothetical protein
MDNTRRGRLLDLLIALLLGGGAFGLYRLTLAPTVLAGDGGEFQFVPYLLGVAHPTGYPLYCLLGYVWSHLLPAGDVAFRMNLFSAFWAALAVGLLYPMARMFLRHVFPSQTPTAAGGEVIHRLLAILAAITFAVTPTLWSQVVIAEVYGLHIFLVVLLLTLLLAWGERRSGSAAPDAPESRSRTILLLAACYFGLGLIHHRTTLLLAPAILAYVWLIDRRIYRDWRRVVVPGLLLVLLPLVLYLYLPLRAPHTPYLRLPLAAGRELSLYENTPTEFARFVLGGPFGGSVDLSVDLGERLAMAWGFLRNEVGWAGVILALAGLAQLAFGRVPRGSRRNRRALLALTGLTYATTVAFNLVYTIGDIYVLYIPSYLIIVLWMAVGMGTLARAVAGAMGRMASRSSRRHALGTAAAAGVVVLTFALPLWMAATRYADVDQSGNTRARARWTEILAQPLPRDAVLVSDDRNNMMPMWYFQYVDGVRGDLLGLFPLITPDYPTLGHILDLALGTGRPIYLIKEMPGIDVKVRTVAEGPLWRVLGPAVEGDPEFSRDASLADAVALVGYDLAPQSPRPGDVLAVSLYWEALRPLEDQYHTFVHLLDAQGQKVAQSDRQPGGVYYPTTLWRPGERLRDDHTLTIPGDAPPGVYSLVAGMYALTADGTLEPLGETILVGQVDMEAGVPANLGAGDRAGLDPATIGP